MADVMTRDMMQKNWQSTRRLRLVTAVLAVAALAALEHDAFASEFKVGAITIETPWSRATPGGAKVAAGYLTIKNDAATPDRLVSVTADIAGSAGIHQMSMADGIMKMRELTGSNKAVDLRENNLPPLFRGNARFARLVCNLVCKLLSGQRPL